MKRKTNFKIAFVAAVLTTCSFVYSDKVFALAEDPEAANCAYTGNSSDYCNASDGTHNLKVQNCAPGSTSCSYTPPPATPVIAP